jgi:hypothetical protein
LLTQTICAFSLLELFIENNSKTTIWQAIAVARKHLLTMGSSAPSKDHHLSNGFFLQTQQI